MIKTYSYRNVTSGFLPVDLKKPQDKNDILKLVKVGVNGRGNEMIYGAYESFLSTYPVPPKTNLVLITLTDEQEQFYRCDDTSACDQRMKSGFKKLGILEERFFGFNFVNQYHYGAFGRLEYMNNFLIKETGDLTSALELIGSRILVDYDFALGEEEEIFDPEKVRYVSNKGKMVTVREENWKYERESRRIFLSNIPNSISEVIINYERFCTEEEFEDALNDYKY